MCIILANNYTQEIRMASYVRVKARNGTIYVYENESYWDKTNRKTRHRRRCIGHEDPVTGEIVPNRKKGDAFRKRAQSERTDGCSVLSFGASHILDHFADSTDLKLCLKAAFPMDWEAVLTCAYYLVVEGRALSHVEQWTCDTVTPMNGVLTNQRVSELLQRLDTGRQLEFLMAWNDRADAEQYYAMDITSISSYSEANEFVRYGYNRDHEHLAQINLLMATDTVSGLPLYFRVLPGALNDVRTLRETLQTFQLMKAKKVHYVMDRGFWSHSSIDMFYHTHSRFLIGIPFSDGLARRSVEECRETIVHHSNYHRVGNEDYYISTKLHKWDSHRLYVHTYFNSMRAEDENRRIDRYLHQLREELMTGTRNKAHEDDYAAFFTVTTTPKRGAKVHFRDAAIEQFKRTRAGFFVLGTNDIKDPVHALQVYHTRDTVEKEFDDLKNERDMKRIRVHSAKAMEGRIFIQFIALILESSLRLALNSINWFREHDLRSALDEMKSIRRVQIPGQRPLITTPTGRQQMLAHAFGVELPSCV